MGYTEHLLVTGSVVFHCNRVIAIVFGAQPLNPFSVGARYEALHCLLGDIGADVLFIVVVSVSDGFLPSHGDLWLLSLGLRGDFFKYEIGEGGYGGCSQQGSPEAKLTGIDRNGSNETLVGDLPLFRGRPFIHEHEKIFFFEEHELNYSLLS